MKCRLFPFLSSCLFKKYSTSQTSFVGYTHCEYLLLFMGCSLLFTSNWTGILVGEASAIQCYSESGMNLCVWCGQGSLFSKLIPNCFSTRPWKDLLSPLQVPLVVCQVTVHVLGLFINSLTCLLVYSYTN